MSAPKTQAILVLPHCPAMDKPREKPEDPGVRRRPKGKPLLAVAAALAAAFLLLFAAVPRNGSIRSLGQASGEMLREQAAIEKNWRLNQEVQIFLVEGRDRGEALARVRAAEARLRERMPGVETASLGGLWPAREAQEENIRAWDRLVAERGGDFAIAFRAAAAGQGFAPDAFAPFLRWFLGRPRTIGESGMREAGLGFLLDNFLAEKNGKSKIIFVNKTDLENANYYKILENLKTKFGPSICPCVVPVR